MKSLLNGRFVIAVLTVACLATVLLTVVPIRSGTPGPGEYDPWLDWNDDGKLDMKDIGRVASAFGTGGQNISKASLAYDSGWLDLRNETGETYTITHNMNDTELQVDARKITPGWNKTYGGINLDWMYSMVQTSDEGYALTGRTESFGTGGTDFWLVKTDASGNMMWNQTYGGTGYDGAWALVQTREGGYALVGSTTSFGTGDLDFWLVKTDSAGTMQWNKTYGGTDFDYASALVQTSDEGYALAGRTESFGAGNSDCWLVKTDAAGNAQWNRTYGGTNWESMHDLVQTSDGGYALAGETFSFGPGNDDFWLVKTDSAGTMQWNKTYGGTSRDEAYALVQTGDGGYALAGYTESFGTGDDLDFWLVKTDVESGLAWMYSSANTITLYRGATDVHWNFVRVRLWKPR